ncbi:MAG: protein-disulfide isomerase [Desulfuromonas sp.]|nr:MAG: protein-disulfide isomerase [Desulfuromonas sp.]
MIRYLPILLLVILAVTTLPNGAYTMDGCGAGECMECHSIEKSEAQQILAKTGSVVLDADFAEVPGLFQVNVEKDGQKATVYLDFSKQYLFAGQIFKITDEATKPEKKVEKLSRDQYDAIPTTDALLLGDRLAEKKVIVFTDPECPYCIKLHPELEKVVEQDPNIAFLIKMFPLASHPNSYEKSKSIICSQSLDVLEKSFAGENVAAPACETDAVDRTLKLVKDYGIRSTPTLILPEGTVAPGYRKAEDLINLINAFPAESAKG